MTFINQADGGGAPTEHERIDTNATPALEETVVRHESRRERRRRRRAERRARMTRARTTWVATAVDAGLPEQLQDRLPGWASTARGRVLLSGSAVVALLVWALVFMVIAGL